MQYGQGASTALPIWAKFFQKVYADSVNFKQEINPEHTFAVPEGKLNIELNCKKFEGGGGSSKQVINEFE
jgi:membrane carboxypeptidase/penicillin-binding protein